MKTRWLCSYSDAKCAFIHIIPLRCSPLFYLQQRLRQIAKFLLKHEMKSKYKQSMPIRETETHIISSLFVSVVRNYVVRANLISRRNKIETPKSQTKYIEPYTFWNNLLAKKVLLLPRGNFTRSLCPSWHFSNHQTNKSAGLQKARVEIVV